MICIGPVRRAGFAGHAANGVDGVVVHILRVVEMYLFQRSRRQRFDFVIGG